MKLSSFLSGCVALAATSAVAEHHVFNWDVEEWVVDYMRPTVSLHNSILPWNKGAVRQSPFKIPEEQRKNAFLINNQYPGPAIEVYEGDTVEVHVNNKLAAEAISLHWHGVHVPGTPWMDGSRSVAQGPIQSGSSFVYNFTAVPAGTHYYHAHMDYVQSAKGLKGPFIIKKREDRYKDLYDEEMTVSVSDEWRDPEKCLRLEGAMAGNPVCADVRHTTFNGQYGDGSSNYPYPLLEVVKGKRYRMRFIMMGSNTENYVMRIAGHQMTLIAKDGKEVEPLQISSFNMHLGERYDVIISADQNPGNYLVSAQYDYACSLTPGNFIPPGFSAVPACEFYAFLHYKGHRGQPKNRKGSPYKVAPSGSGGGVFPKAVSGVDYDLTNFKAWSMAKPVDVEAEPEEPDVRYVVNMGLNGPTYKDPSDRPLEKGRYYMDIDGPDGTNLRRSYREPSSPLYLTKGQCGVDDIPLINVPENATTVELIINNLTPAAHVIHLHGQKFKVINYADFEWCNLNKTACFVMPHWANPCPREDRAVGDPTHPNLVMGMFWGCKYNERRNRVTQNLANPLQMDSVQVWQRSWIVIRFKATTPGFWLFHCHMEQHIPMGMQMVFNVLPSKQPFAPKNLPVGAGTCPMPGLEGWLESQQA